MRPCLHLIKCHGGRLGWNVFFLLEPCEKQDHLRAHPHSKSGARVGPGSGDRGPNRKIRGDLSLEPAGVWGSWSLRPFRQLRFATGIPVFDFPFGRRLGARDFARTFLMGRKAQTLRLQDAMTSVRRVQTCRTPTRTAIKRRVRPGRAIYSIAWTAEHTLQHRLRKGIWRGLLVGAKCTSPRSGVPMRRAHLRLIK